MFILQNNLHFLLYTTIFIKYSNQIIYYTLHFIIIFLILIVNTRDSHFLKSLPLSSQPPHTPPPHTHTYGTPVTSTTTLETTTISTVMATSASLSLSLFLSLSLSLSLVWVWFLVDFGLGWLLVGFGMGFSVEIGLILSCFFTWFCVWITKCWNGLGWWMVIVGWWWVGGDWCWISWWTLDLFFFFFSMKKALREHRWEKKKLIGYKATVTVYIYLHDYCNNFANKQYYRPTYVGNFFSKNV